MLITQYIIFTIAITSLFLGAELLVKGSSKVALGFGIRPIIVGLTIVAMATSSPELAVSIIAAVQRSKDIALGNIIGSNIANLTLVIGMAAIIKPLKLSPSTFKHEMPFLLLTTGIFWITSINGWLDIYDAIILLFLFIIFLWFIIHSALRNREVVKEIEKDLKEAQKSSNYFSLNIIMIFSGITLLIAGSVFMVKSAVHIATVMGVSQYIIGMTVVAVGTSLPELAISTVGVMRGQIELVVGNAVGSNIFNMLFVLGIVSFIFPLPVESQLLSFHYPFLFLVTLIFWPMTHIKFHFGRVSGIFLLLVYSLFIFLLFN